MLEGKEVKPFSDGNSQSPDQLHYVAHLRNEANIRVTSPESGTRVKFFIRVVYKIPLFPRLLTRILKVIGMYERRIIQILSPQMIKQRLYFFMLESLWYCTCGCLF